MGHLGLQCSPAPGRPILHLVFIFSQTSAGKTFRRLALRSRGLNPNCLECSIMSQDAPSNASELVCECDGEDVVMQPLFGCFEPRLEPVTIPALRPDQYSPKRTWNMHRHGPTCRGGHRYHSPNETLWKCQATSLRLDARELNHLGPFFDIFGDELGELVRRVGGHR